MNPKEKLIEKLRIKLGLWLLISPKVTATSLTMNKKIQEIKCIHCGKNPFFIG